MTEKAKTTAPDKPDASSHSVNAGVTERDETPDTATPPPTLAERMDTGVFSDDDADETGWIVHTDSAGTTHRVPVRYWSRYERLHNL